MALNDIEIANLLRGDLSDIEDFNDDDDDVDEETIIEQRISEMTEFVDNNNAELNNLVSKSLFILCLFFYNILI